jgi:hypothetical protein
VIPSLQESVPGQLTTSVISSAPASARPCSTSRVDRLVANPPKHEVLLDRGACVAARVLAHDLAEATQLLGREVAAADDHLDGRETLLALRGDV